MAQPYLGEIRLVGFNFAPEGWAFCSGQLLAIAQNDALFALLGTTYGGDGVNTFQLPDLRSRVAIHQGNAQGTSFVIGQQAGSESATLIESQMPQHQHTMMGASSAVTPTPSPTVVLGAPATATLIYVASPNTNTTLLPNALSPAPGANQAHENRQPYLGMNYIIALSGIFPSRG